MKVRFSLRPVPPFSLELTAWTLRRNPRNEIDRWEDNTYRRALLIDGAPVDVSATQTAAGKNPLVSISAESSRPVRRLRKKVADSLDSMLGLRLDLSPFYRFAQKHPQFANLARQFSGVKPPRFPSIWEALVNAISCQQLSLTVGIILMNRLARQFGPSSISSAHAFPRPEDVAGARAAELRKIGYSLHKASTIIELARAISRGRLKLEEIETLDDQQAVDFLTGLKGIGRWSAQYVLLRGLRRINVFPADDVGFQDKLTRWMHLRRRLDYAGVHKALGDWRRYGGILYFFMLLNHLQEEGLLTAPRIRAI